MFGVVYINLSSSILQSLFSVLFSIKPQCLTKRSATLRARSLILNMARYFTLILLGFIVFVLTGLVLLILLMVLLLVFL